MIGATRFTVMSDDRLMVVMLAGNAAAWPEVQNRFQARIRGLARSWAPDFSGAQLDDVVGEFWLLLLRKPRNAFQPQRGTLLNFFTGIVRSAIQRVWAASHPDGLPSHLPRLGERSDSTRPLESLDESTDTSSSRSDWRRPFDLIDLRIDLEIIVRAADPEVAAALRLMRSDDLSFEVAAEAVAMSRFALRRKINELAQRFSDVPEKPARAA